MILHKIVLQNFMSIREAVVPLNNRGLVLIDGVNLDNPSLNNNGAGKSTLLEAIVYALYNKTLRGLKGDAIVNKVIQKNSVVSLTLEDDDGSIYKIIRHRKHSKYRNKSILYRDNVNITPATESAFDIFIENLIQADFITFTASLLYSSQSFKFAMATDSEIKSTFDTILGLDILSKSHELTLERIKQVQADIDSNTSLLEENLSKLETTKEKLSVQKHSKDEYDSQYEMKVSQTQQSIISLKEKDVNLHEELDNLQEQCNAHITELEVAKARLVKLNATMKKIEELKDAIQGAKHAISDEQYAIKGCNEVIKSNKQKIIQLEALQKSKNKNIQVYQEKISNLTEQIGEPCPTCGAPLTAEALLPAQHEYQYKIGELQKDIKNIQDDIDKLYDNNTNSNIDIKNHNDKISELREEMKEYYALLDKFQYIQDEKEQAESDRFYIQETVFDDKANIKVKSGEITQNLTLLKQMETYLQEITTSKNPYNDIVINLEKEINDINIGINELNTILPKLKNKLKILQFWSVAFSNQGIKSYILDDITPFLNKQANMYLGKLTSGQIEIIFSTQTTLKGGGQREKFSLNVVNKNGGEGYISNSGGERKRVDLSINLALQDLVASRGSKKINIAIFDEVFDSLDENGVDGVVSLLRDLSKTKSTILVVSHNEYFKSFFTNCMTIVKKDGFSYLK